MNCYTYMVQCSDGTLYTGWTNDLKKRLENTMPAKVLAIHVALPVKLVYYEVFATKSEAMKRESSNKKIITQAKIIIYN